jgi:hypothetical protein
MQRAWSRIAAIPTVKLEARFGTVEYAVRGPGLPILVCHGVFGCPADAVDGWWTRMLGEGFRIIAPSRFGCFGSTLPPHATPADQAEVYALLLDHLGIDRGGHLFLSHDAQVRAAIGGFIESVAQPERRRR